MTMQKPSIEKKAVERFFRNFNHGLFPSQRVGQAFYNEFNLHKLSDQDALKGLWQADGEEAEKLIREIFTVE
jgi:hypothetical protein